MTQGPSQHRIQQVLTTFSMGIATKTAEMPQSESPQDLPGKLAQHTRDDFTFLLPIPKPEDDLETTARKLHGLADAVSNGGSLKLSSCQASASRKQAEAEAFAKERMSTRELKQYEEWKTKKLTLPVFDWTANRQLPVPRAALKTYTQRAAAMDIIWQRQDTTPAHAAWLTENMPEMMPLDRAITKLRNAQAHLEKHSSMAGLTASEIAELETLQLVNATVEATVARERERVRRLAESVNESCAVLRRRLKGRGR